MDLFEQRLLAEGLRVIEGDSPALSTSDPTAVENNSFEARVLQRATKRDQQLQMSSLFLHFKGLTKNLFSLLALLLFILGASSVQQLFFTEQGTQINFFWAFALFFIPNLFTLCLWLLFFLRPNLLNGGWLARLSLFLLKKIENRFNPQATKNPHFWALFGCYFRVRFSGLLGRYQLSAVTHLLWLSYFSGAILMLVIMLATHQVDFIWQTSILSLDSFQWLTELLAYIPHLLGISVPDSIQIQQSNVAMINNLVDAQHSRLVWSSLLISSLLIYGLIPRVGLWLLMLFLFKIKKRQFSLNLSHPYYVQLRQQLKPNVTSLGIRDPDTVKIIASEPLDSERSPQQLPASFYPIALELSAAQLLTCRQHVERYSAKHLDLLENICDFKAQQSLLDRFAGSKQQEMKQQNIVLYVSILRVPDRGLLGFIRALTELAGNTFYLLLIDDTVSESEQLNKRRSDWYTLATKAGISLDNIIHLQRSHSSEDI